MKNEETNKLLDIITLWRTDNPSIDLSESAKDNLRDRIELYFNGRNRYFKSVELLDGGGSGVLSYVFKAREENDVLTQYKMQFYK